MSAPEKHDTHHKALSINLEDAIFGSFAEIGAGQEVARWFFRVGGASGTVAKTISAYDKEVSDDLYGAGTRYVSKPRLQAMLDNEWAQLLSQLHASRGATTKFFSFVDTVSARNYAGTNECHGWVGLRFQLQPGAEPNDVILHLNLRDDTNLRQQEAVGILGVNLLYAVHHSHGSPEELLAGIFEDLGLHRMEIDSVDLSGPVFTTWDHGKIHAYLVSGSYAEAVVFPAGEELLPPGELLHKRALVFAPARLENADHLHETLIRETLAQLPQEELKESRGGLGLFGLAIAGAGEKDEATPVEDIVNSVAALQKLGYGAMLFRAQELYTMSAYANRYTKSRIHFAIGLAALVRVFQDRYKDLDGSVLEGVSRLFTQNVRVSVYPVSVQDARKMIASTGLTTWRWKETNGMVYADDLQPPEPLNHLYQYLLGNRFILPVRPAKSTSASE
jgi:hypothetical protein